MDEKFWKKSQVLSLIGSTVAGLLVEWGLYTFLFIVLDGSSW